MSSWPVFIIYECSAKLPIDLGISAGARMGRSLTIGAGRPPGASEMGGPEGGRPAPGPAPAPGPVVTDTECGASWGVVEWACCTGSWP